MLQGLEKGWFEVYADAQYGMRSALCNRRGENFGILIDDDYWALYYQIYNYRAERAKFALLERGFGRFVAYQAKGTKEEYEAAKKKAKEMEREQRRNKREEAKKAKELLKEKFSYMFEDDHY